MKETESENPKEKRQLKPTVSILPDFLSGFMDLPRDVQRKVVDFFKKFSRNPTLPGINYETLSSAADDKVRSVRIDGVYRAIVITPEEGNVYLLVRVDREDDLYRWVKDLKFSRDEDSEEVIVTHLVEKEEIFSGSPKSSDGGLLSLCSDAELESVGVPSILLPSVRAITDPDDYVLLSGFVKSSETTTALQFLANEFPAEEVESMYEDSMSIEIEHKATIEFGKLTRNERSEMDREAWFERMMKIMQMVRQDTSSDGVMTKAVRGWKKLSGFDS